MAEGFVERCSGDDYALGTAVIALTQKVRVNVEVRDRVAPLVRALADRCEELVYLTVREGSYVLYVYAVESSRRLIARTAIGDRGYLHSTGVGKAVLAHLSETEIRAVAAEVGLPRATDRTMTTLEDVLAEARRTRARGYSFDDQENEVGNFCIGAAILDCPRRAARRLQRRRHRSRDPAQPRACARSVVDEHLLRYLAPARLGPRFRRGRPYRGSDVAPVRSRSIREISAAISTHCPRSMQVRCVRSASVGAVDAPPGRPSRPHRGKRHSGE